MSYFLEKLRKKYDTVKKYDTEKSTTLEKYDSEPTQMGRALFATQTSMPIMQNVFIKHPKRSKRQEENDYFGKIKREPRIT